MVKKSHLSTEHCLQMGMSHRTICSYCISFLQLLNSHKQGTDSSGVMNNRKDEEKQSDSGRHNAKAPLCLVVALW